MKKLILGLIVLGLMGCGDITNEEAELIMPAGYKIMCFVEGGKYTVWMPRYGGYMNPNVFNTKKAAAEHVTRWERNKPINHTCPSDLYTWTDCQEGSK